MAADEKETRGEIIVVRFILNVRSARIRFTSAQTVALLRIACVAAVLCTCAGQSYSQGGPPLITDDPGTPENGKWENNFAFTLDNTASGQEYETPIADINYGLGGHIQLKIELPWLVEKAPNTAAETGLGNTLVGVKVRFLDEESSFVSVSTYPQYLFNYSRTAAVGGTQFFLPVEIAKSMGRLEFDCEAGYNFIQNTPGLWTLGGIAGYFPVESTELLVEVHAGSVLGSGGGNETFLNLGGRYKFTDSVILLVSAGRSLSPPGANEYLGYLGMQFLM